MTRNIKCTVLFLLAFTASFAQNSLNDYKYVIVPNKYEFLEKADEYRLNWLTKSLFSSLKFEALMNDEALPEDLKNNGCLALKADVLGGSKIFKTLLKIQLKNCDGEVIYTSQEGVSREKNYKKSYHEALRMAFKFLEAQNYSYKPNDKVLEKVTASNNEEVKEIQKLKEEIKELKAENKPEEKIVEVKEIKQQAISKKKAEQVILDKAVIAGISLNTNVLTAELITGSLNYLVKDNNGNLIYTLLYSGQKDLYMIKGKDAIVSKVNNTWAITQYVGNNLQMKSIIIKF